MGEIFPLAEVCNLSAFWCRGTIHACCGIFEEDYCSNVRAFSFEFPTLGTSIFKLICTLLSLSWLVNDKRTGYHHSKHLLCVNQLTSKIDFSEFFSSAVDCLHPSQTISGIWHKTFGLNGHSVGSCTQKTHSFSHWVCDTCYWVIFGFTSVIEQQLALELRLSGGVLMINLCFN